MKLRIPRPIRTILFAGTKQLTEGTQRRPVVIINSLALLTAILVLIVGTTFFIITGSYFIIGGVIAECAALSGVIYLNGKHKHFLANVFTLLIHCTFALYFGALLGAAMPVELITTFLLVFLVGASFLVYRQKTVRLICFLSTILLFLAVTANNRFHFVTPVPMNATVESAIRVGSWMGMIILIGFMMLLIIRQMDKYIRENHRLVKELKRESEAKSKFLSETTHEIKTPLNSVLGFAQMLRLHHPDDENIKHLFTAAMFTREVVTNVLDMARIEADKYYERSISSFPLAQCIRTCISMNSFIANQRNVEFHCSLDHAIPAYIQSDRIFLTKILNNLLSNAAKFSIENTAIVVRVRRKVEMLHYTVSNITELQDERMAKIFLPFESERNEGVEGTGLGLQINKKLVELLGGRIYARKEGKQITFHFELPFFYHEDYDKVRSGEAPVTAMKDEINFVGYRMLFVEDNVIGQRVLTQFLNTTGAEIISMDTGVGVIERTKMTEPDLIILDAHLPGMSGLDIVRHLKGSPELEHIPIIITSGDVFSEAIQTFLAAGADAYIIKPIVFAELQAAILKLLPVKIHSGVLI